MTSPTARERGLAAAVEQALRSACALAACDHRSSYYSSEPSGGHGGTMQGMVCADCGATKSYWGGWRRSRLVEALMAAVQELR